MSTPKKFLIYAICLIAFFFFSNFIISVGLNSSYKKMDTQGDVVDGVEITQAESTLVNGRIKGNIKTGENENLIGKYLKLDFYSKRDNLMGTKYIPITEINDEGKQPFSAYFELEDVTYYKTSIVDQKVGKEIELLPKEMSRPEIVLATIVTLLIFWG